MRKTLILAILICALRVEAAYTEFYCDSNVGTNINSGSTTNAAAIYTAVNGNWDGTSVYTPTDGSTPASTVSAGMWASIYIDNSTNLAQAGTAGGCVMLITNVAAGANGAITFNRAAFMSNSPASGATGRSIKVGGAWNGPKDTIRFPFNYVATTATNSTGVFPRVNFKATSTYSVTSAMVHNNVGPVRFQGMTLVPDDGGKATIDGGTSGASYTVLAMTAVNTDLGDLIFANNGATGNAILLNPGGTECYIFRVVVHDSRGHGLSVAGNSTVVDECEVYLCDKANTASLGGINVSSGSTVTMRNTISHDNASNGCGYVLVGGTILINCIADSNGSFGILASTVQNITAINCDFYNNGSSGIDFTGSTPTSMLLENCNFLKNGQFGVSSTGSSLRNGAIVNCAFGSGTQINSSGSFGSGLGVSDFGSITYAADVTPWQDPANGDFRIVLPAAKAVGRGSFTETQASYTGTIGYPDIGAAQSASTNATTRATSFSQ